MKTQLEMVFVDTAGRKFTVRVDEPRADLSPQEIQAAMELIQAQDAFRSNYGALVSAQEANIVTTETVNYSFAE